MEFNGKVLLVDDEPHIRKFIAVLLRQLGAPTIFEAGNGEEALQIFGAERPDLVLLDVNMPLRDGISTLDGIMKIDPNAIVIMLTSLSSRQMIQQAADLGASNYIRKDNPKEEIFAALKETIEACFGEG